MEIRIRSTGQVMFWNEFRDLLLQQNPSRLITVALQTQEWLNQNGADLILKGVLPTRANRYQFWIHDGVEEIDGKWHEKFVIGPIFTDKPATATEPAITAEEQEIAYRARRDEEKTNFVLESINYRLKELDWTQGEGIPDSVSAPAAVIRQALRDVPTQAGFPWEVTWPE
jgi:hypothetical protein